MKVVKYIFFSSEEKLSQRGMEVGMGLSLSTFFCSTWELNNPEKQACVVDIARSGLQAERAGTTLKKYSRQLSEQVLWLLILIFKQKKQISLITV